MTKAKFITPAVTPIGTDGKIDYDSLGRLYDSLINAGISGILVLGSIGEFFGFSAEEKESLISFAAKYVNKRTDLIIGTGGMDADETIRLSEYAYSLGIEKVIIISPYYFALSDDCIYSYYSYIAKHISGKMLLYNFPDRTGYDISPNVTLHLLRTHNNIIGYKDTVAGITHTKELIEAVKCEFPDFEIFSGFDDNFLSNVAAGGNGCIAGLSNLYPDLCMSWVDSVNSGNMTKAFEIYRCINKLQRIYSVGKPFVPYIKKAMQLKGLIAYDGVTFPMCRANESETETLRQILSENS